MCDFMILHLMWLYKGRLHCFMEIHLCILVIALLLHSTGVLTESGKPFTMTPRVMTVFVLIVCVYCRCVSVARIARLPSPSETVGEGRSSAVYTVNGQELCLAFIIEANTQDHCGKNANSSLLQLVSSFRSSGLLISGNKPTVYPVYLNHFILK